MYRQKLLGKVCEPSIEKSLTNPIFLSSRSTKVEQVHLQIHLDRRIEIQHPTKMTIIRRVILNNEASMRKVRECASSENFSFHWRTRYDLRWKRTPTPISENLFMVKSHACISTYLQIDHDTSSRRDDSSSKHVSTH